MNIRVDGQSILVTGASRGIGHAIAKSLLESGAFVGLHCRSNVDSLLDLKKQYPAKCSVHEADLSDPVAAKKLFAEFADKVGQVDAVVNNAGVALETPLTTSFDSWEVSFDRMMAINLKSVVVLCREALRHFVNNDGGRIVNIASRAAFRGDTADFMAYAASKGALVAYTRSIARAFGKQGVKAFILAPGYTRTDMAEDFIKKYGEAHAIDDLALDRLTTPEDIAPIVTLLLSGMADHTTGCSIDINAGSYVH